MPLSDVVQSQTSVSQAPIGRDSFGVPLIMGVFSGPQIAAFGSDRVRSLSASTWRATLTALAFASSDLLWAMVAALFAEGSADSPRANRVYIGRRLAPVAQVDNVNVIGTSDGAYTITILDRATLTTVAYTHTATGQTATQIKDALIALVNAGSQGVTAASVDTDSLSLTADTAGVGFIATVSSPSADLEVVSQVANVGPGEDLATFDTDTEGGFYFVLSTSRETATILETAYQVETWDRPLLYIGQTDDANAQGTASPTDVGSILLAGEYARTRLVWALDAAPNDAVLVGGRCGSRPGSLAWGAWQPEGGTAIVPTDSGRLKSKGYLYLERFAALASSAWREGVGVLWIDLLWGRDYLDAELQRAVWVYLNSGARVPYTDGGAAGVEAVMRGVFADFDAAGFLLYDTLAIDVPLAADQSDSDRGSRHFPGIEWSADVTGAIYSVTLSGTLIE